MKALKINLLILISVLFTSTFYGQEACDSLDFIQCKQNKIIFNENDTNLLKLIQKLNSYKNTHSQKIQIVQIGDSHLQAGFLSEKIKQSLFQFFSPLDSFASPGFIFPYTIAQTNNPFFYQVSYSGNWEWCKNVDTEKSCHLGLSGITIQTKDSVSAFKIKMQNQKYPYPVKYYFNNIRLLHNNDSSLKIFINDQLAKCDDRSSSVMLPSMTDSVSVKIYNHSGQYIEIYGLILENYFPEITYHTIGVNGATAQSYLKCDYFSNQLKDINPDLIILSLGTNEAYDKDFSKLKQEFELKDLIYQIQDVVPNAAILLTTPNDHLKNKKYKNPNIIDVRDNFFKISHELNLSVWDFYEIMGGDDSIWLWYEKGLTGDDKLHFKRLGYEIQGELFSKALINLIEKESVKNPLLKGGARGGN